MHCLLSITTIIIAEITIIHCKNVSFNEIKIGETKSYTIDNKFGKYGIPENFTFHYFISELLLHFNSNMISFISEQSLQSRFRPLEMNSLNNLRVVTRLLRKFQIT